MDVKGYYTKKVQELHQLVEQAEHNIVREDKRVAEAISNRDSSHPNDLARIEFNTVAMEYAQSQLDAIVAAEVTNG
jgi:hypothetical protein